MKKKLFSVILALAMIMTLAVPAFATTISGGSTVSGSSTLSGGFVQPTVTITMPNSVNKLILNPYKLKIAAANVGAGDTAEGNTLVDVTDQVVSVGLGIKNESNTDVKVGLKAVATLGTDKMVFATKACTGKETTKSVFAFVELQKGDKAGTEAAVYPSAWTDPADVNAKCYPQLVFVSGTTGVSNDAIATLPAKSGDNPNWLYYKIGGNCAVDPTETWTEADTLTAALTFTFTPTVPKTVAFKDSTTMGELADFSDTSAAMGSIVRVEAKSGKTLTSVTAVDATDATVAVTTVTAGKLYWFKVPASDVTVTVAGS